MYLIDYTNDPLSALSALTELSVNNPKLNRMWKANYDRLKAKGDGNMNVAVAHEDVYTGTKISGIKGREEIITALSAIIPANLTVDDVVFLCIGTDRVTGDALGPLCGMMLENVGYTNVFGTIDNPTHALNLSEVIDSLPKGKTIIAIDATMGKEHEVETHSVIKGSLKPGAGFGRNLPIVGDHSITGCVNYGGYANFSNTRLSVVYRMAADIANALIEIFPKGDSVNANERNLAKVHA